jgi:GDPmannose 4,6-dehydratase
MNQDKALITGVFGQDGIFLARLLVSKGYSVIGTYSSLSLNKEQNREYLPREIKLVEISNRNPAALESILLAEKPCEIYNLSALSSVAASFLDPVATTQINSTNPIRVLNFLSENMPGAKFYQAGSSEMFGRSLMCPQTEETPFNPQSPYAESKVDVFEHITKIRKRDSFFAVNGIMYNHESEYRSDQFVSRKITKNIAKILLGKQKNFTLGDLSISRDWGYAADYVSAMWLMMQQEQPEDFVIATGVPRSLRDFVLTAFEIAGLGDDIEDLVICDKNLFRNKEVVNLVGDTSKAKRILGWSPSTPFEKWVGMMIENDIRIESSRN